MIGKGLLQIQLSRYGEARDSLEGALNLAREPDNSKLIMTSLGLSSNVIENQEEARGFIKERIALARSTQNQ
jgi:hypothetical protein